MKCIYGEGIPHPSLNYYTVDVLVERLLNTDWHRALHQGGETYTIQTVCAS